jgi:predicted nucleic acid-binding protein
MRYWDTAALLRAWKEDWIPASGFTRSHTVAEWIAIQTGRGLVYRTPQGQFIKRNLSPKDAAKEAERIFAKLKFQDLRGEQILEAAKLAAKKTGVGGNNFHDFIHVRTAEIYGAGSIVTLNLRDYSRMTKLPLEEPVRGMG